MEHSSTLIQEGLRLVAEGKVKEARDSFRKASQAKRTAESLTYWGWMEYLLGNTERAISLCKKAIKIDPDLGNPYNDIGAYLVVLGREDEALEWFQKAIQSKNYEARQYPHVNLGRIFLSRNLPVRALQEFRKALSYAPGDSTILDAVRAISETLH